MGLTPTRGNKLLYVVRNENIIFISSFWHQGKSLALGSAVQLAMSRKIRWKVGNGMSYRYVPSAYSAVCRIQCEADMIFDWKQKAWGLQVWTGSMYEQFDYGWRSEGAIVVPLHLASFLTIPLQLLCEDKKNILNISFIPTIITLIHKKKTDIEAKRGVEFHYSTRKMENGVS